MTCDLTNVFEQSKRFFGTKSANNAAIERTADIALCNAKELDTQAVELESQSVETKAEPVEKVVVHAHESSEIQSEPTDKKKKKKKAKLHANNDTEHTEDKVLSKEDVERNEKSSRTVFVSNVTLNAKVKNLKVFFGSCGPIQSARFRSLPAAGCAVNDHKNQNLVKKVCANKKIYDDSKDFCNAYVTFVNLASVEKALQQNGSNFMGRIVRVDHEKPSLNPHSSVFVGNLPFKATEEKLWQYFQGKLKGKGDTDKPVESVRIIRDQASGSGKGFGYVRFCDSAWVPRALLLNGKQFEGRDLRISVCGKRFKNGKNRASGAMRGPQTEGAVRRISAKRPSSSTPIASLPMKSSARTSFQEKKKRKLYSKSK